MSDVAGEVTESATLATVLPGFTGTTLPPWLEDRLRAGDQ